jgi:ribosomal protein L37E
MAIKCKRCARNIYGKATTCSYCGKPVNTSNDQNDENRTNNQNNTSVSREINNSTGNYEN